MTHANWHTPVVGTAKVEVVTPALVIDAAVMESNLQAMSDFVGSHDVDLRPHFKTHKCVQIARRQLELGAIGITCAKLSEAEVLLEAGIDNILIANQIVSPPKLERLAHLAAGGHVIVAIDDAGNLNALSTAAQRAGSTVHVLIEIDVGLHRCGVATAASALALAKHACDLPGVELAGVMGYEGHTVFEVDRSKRKHEVQRSMQKLVAVAEYLRQHDIVVEIVSAGGTGTYDITGQYPGVTEIQAGSYPLMDTKYRELGLPFQPALTLLTTVISVSPPNRAIVDAGMKSLSSDNGLPRIVSPAGVDILALHEEHGILELLPDAEVDVGTHIELVPSHVCTTVNLHDNYIVVSNGVVEDIWPIVGRGRSW